MQCAHNQLGAYAINEASPAGCDPRNGEAYAAAQTEIEKLNSIHSNGNVDWQKVADYCTHILASEGKDLHVAIWLLCAWSRVRGFPGLVDGVQVLKDILTLYWDSMTPPVSRLRARRNQAEWLITWLDKLLDEPCAPLTVEDAEHLSQNWVTIDDFWREQDADSPNFLRLRRRLADIPVIAPRIEVAPPAPSAANDIRPEQSASVSSPSVPRREMAVEAPNVLVPENIDGIQSSVEKIFESLAPLQAWCLEQYPTLPLFLRLNRQAAWFTLIQLPASEGRTTRLQPPPELLRNTLMQLLQVGEPVDVIRFCESRINSFPFWLDLNRACHAALMQAGGAPGASALALEVCHLLARFPNLAELTFADGMPFADNATQRWLENLQPVAMSTTANTGDFQNHIDAACRIAAEGSLNDALLALQQQISSATSERDRFRLRAAQCTLVHRFDPQAELYIPLESLLLQADELNLAQWEPELVKPLLEMMLVYSDQPDWSRRLARLDLPQFWRTRRAHSA